MSDNKRKHEEVEPEEEAYEEEPFDSEADAFLAALCGVINEEAIEHGEDEFRGVPHKDKTVDQMVREAAKAAKEATKPPKKKKKG